MKDKPDAEFTTEALNILCPNGFSYNEKTITTVSDPVPTQAELDAKVAELKADYESLSWKRSRQDSYPELQECIHALLDGGDTLTDLQAKRAEVKSRFPKG